jgi:hypothetical protein
MELLTNALALVSPGVISYEKLSVKWADLITLSLSISFLSDRKKFALASISLY